jgi:hypothetical protein
MKQRKWIEDYFIQLAAYACAHNAVHGTEIDHGVIMMVAQNNEVQEFVTCGREFDGYKDKWCAGLSSSKKWPQHRCRGPRMPMERTATANSWLLSCCQPNWDKDGQLSWLPPWL